MHFGETLFRMKEIDSCHTNTKILKNITEKFISNFSCQKLSYAKVKVYFPRKSEYSEDLLNWYCYELKPFFSIQFFFFFPASGLFQYDMITYTKVLWKVQRLMFVSVKSMAYLPVGNFKPFQFFLFIPKEKRKKKKKKKGKGKGICLFVCLFFKQRFLAGRKTVSMLLILQKGNNW